MTENKEVMLLCAGGKQCETSFFSGRWKETTLPFSHVRLLTFGKIKRKIVAVAVAVAVSVPRDGTQLVSVDWAQYDVVLGLVFVQNVITIHKGSDLIFLLILFIDK